MAITTRFRWKIPAACGLALLALFAFRGFTPPDPSASSAPLTMDARSVVPSDTADDRADATFRTTAAWRPNRPLSADDVARLAAHLEELAAADHELALLLADQATDPAQRNLLTMAVLRGWVRTDPDAAADWALSQTSMELGDAVGALLDGAAVDPQKAVGLLDDLARRLPERAEEFSGRLIHAFEKAGEDRAAAEFAVATAANHRFDWVESSYDRWAATQPREAVDSAYLIVDSRLQIKAFNAAIQRWGESDPRALIDYAVTLPAGANRSGALSVAASAWVATDLPGLEAWLADLPPGRDLDACAVVVGTHPAIVRDDPQRAVGWAQTIIDVDQRSAALATIVNQWAVADPVAAATFARDCEDLDPQIRTAFLSRLEPPIGQN
jgi:hypothetical protein